MTTTSFMGILVVALNRALHKRFPVPNPSYFYAPLLVACITTIASGVPAAMFSSRIRRVKASDNRRRVSRLARDDSHNRFDSYASTTELLPIQVPEDEAQRKQLLRLLMRQENNRTQSPDNGNTYRIDLPPALASGERWNGQHLSVPTPSSNGQRGRSSSRSKIPMSGLLGKLVPGNRSSSATTESFIDPRERRRYEIEQGVDSRYSVPPRPTSDPFSSSPLLGHVPQPQGQGQLPWTSARYA